MHLSFAQCAEMILLILCSQTPRKAALQGDFSAQFLRDVVFYHLAHLTNKPKQMSKHYHLTNKLIK